MTTANTIWILWLIAPGGLTSFQGWYWTLELCEQARKTYTQSQYYRAECRSQER